MTMPYQVLCYVVGDQYHTTEVDLSVDKVRCAVPTSTVSSYHDSLTRYDLWYRRSNYWYAFASLLFPVLGLRGSAQIQASKNFIIIIAAQQYLD